MSSSDSKTPICPHLLSTNYSPLPQEEANVRDQLSAKRIQLSKLNFEINTTEEALQLLKKKRDVLHKDIVATESILSPIRQIPDEVIAEILSAATARDPNRKIASWQRSFSPTDVLDPLKAPWVYGRVCQRWRRVIHSLPSAWSDINVTMQAVGPHSFAILQTVLSRAKSAPLYVRFYQSEDVFSLKEERTALVRELVLAADRWCEVNIDLPLNKTWLKAFEPLSHCRLPLLQSLYISHNAYTSFPVRVLDFFSTADDLKKVHITASMTKDVETIDIMSVASLPWSKLTHFKCSISRFDIDAYFRELRRLPAISRLSILANGHSANLEARVASVAPLHLPSLRQAEIRKLDMLPPFRLPSLEDVKVDDWHASNFVKLQSMVTQSGCLLKSLILHQLLPDTISMLRESMPNLVYLRIYTGGSKVAEVRTLIKALTVVELSATSTTLVPRLTTLALTFAFTRRQDIDLIARMLQSRCTAAEESISRLTNFDAENEKKTTPHWNDHPMILQLVEKGLHCQVLYDMRIWDDSSRFGF